VVSKLEFIAKNVIHFFKFKLFILSSNKDRPHRVLSIVERNFRSFILFLLGYYHCFSQFHLAQEAEWPFVFEGENFQITNNSDNDFSPSIASSHSSNPYTLLFGIGRHPQVSILWETGRYQWDILDGVEIQSVLLQRPDVPFRIVDGNIFLLSGRIGEVETMGYLRDQGFVGWTCFRPGWYSDCYRERNE